MKSNEKNKKLNIAFISVISIIIVAIIILLAVAVSSSLKPDTETSTSPSADSSGDEEEDIFDANDVISREDPVIMTVDMFPVYFSEFNYFYYISASEVIAELDYSEDSTQEEIEALIKDLIANGKDGKSFEEIIFERAKTYSSKYAVYKDSYISEGYLLNETYQLYLMSNFMTAENREELDEINQELLEKYGVVRNEYINILVYNDAISSYRQILIDNAEYSDEELKKTYDDMKDQFSYIGVRMIMLGSEDEQLAEQLKKQLDSGYDSEQLVMEYSVSPSKDSNKGLLEGNIDDFADEEIKNWLKTAKLNESVIVKRDDYIYIAKYENDGSFENRKEEVKEYKAVYDFDTDIDRKIESGEIEILMDEEVVKKLELPLFLKEYAE